MTKEEIIEVTSKCFVVDDDLNFYLNTYSFYKSEDDFLVTIHTLKTKMTLPCNYININENIIRILYMENDNMLLKTMFSMKDVIGLEYQKVKFKENKMNIQILNNLIYFKTCNVDVLSLDALSFHIKYVYNYNHIDAYYDQGACFDEVIFNRDIINYKFNHETILLQSTINYCIIYGIIR